MIRIGSIPAAAAYEEGPLGLRTGFGTDLPGPDRTQADRSGAETPLPSLAAPTKPVQNDLTGQDLDRVSVGDRVLATDALALETSRRPPDACSPALVHNVTPNAGWENGSSVSL